MRDATRKIIVPVAVAVLVTVVILALEVRRQDGLALLLALVGAVALLAAVEVA